MSRPITPQSNQNVRYTIRGLLFGAFIAITATAITIAVIVSTAGIGAIPLAAAWFSVLGAVAASGIGAGLGYLVSKFKSSKNNPAKATINHSTTNMQKALGLELQPIVVQPETPNVAPENEKTLDQHVKEIYEKRNEILILAGGDPEADNQALLNNPQLAAKFVSLVYKEIKDRGLKTADVANFPEFKSGKLGIAMKIIMSKKLDDLSTEIFNNRDALWNTALELAENDSNKQLLIFTLLLRKLFKSAGLNLADAKDHLAFQSGRLAQAMRVYIMMKSGNSASPEEELDHDGDKKAAVILLAQKHAADGKGLLTRAHVKGETNIRAAAKKAALHNHPDRAGDAGDREVLLAANEIINLQKDQLLDVYLAELEKARNRQAPRK